MKKSESLNTTICRWLETHECEFTSPQLASLLNQPRKRVSDQLSILSRKGVIKVIGQSAKAHIYKRCEAGEVMPEVKQKKTIPRTPGVLGITTHRLDHGIERVIF